MAALPDLPWDKASTVWAALLSPLLGRVQLNSLVIKDIALISGSNTINHRLGRKLVGWKLTRVRGPAVIYDTQDTNPKPQQTLVLESDASVIIDLEVF